MYRQFAIQRCCQGSRIRVHCHFQVKEAYKQKSVVKKLLAHSRPIYRSFLIILLTSLPLQKFINDFAHITWWLSFSSVAVPMLLLKFRINVYILSRSSNWHLVGLTLGRVHCWFRQQTSMLQISCFMSFNNQTLIRCEVFSWS